MSAQFSRVRALGLLAVLSTACDSESVGPDPMSVSSALVTAPVCETITFNEFGHSDLINSLSLFGLNLTVTTTGAKPTRPAPTRRWPSTPTTPRTTISNALGHTRWQPCSIRRAAE